MWKISLVRFISLWLVLPILLGYFIEWFSTTDIDVGKILLRWLWGICFMGFICAIFWGINKINESKEFS